MWPIMTLCISLLGACFLGLSLGQLVRSLIALNRTSKVCRSNYRNCVMSAGTRSKSMITASPLSSNERIGNG